ncbi:MAG: MarR family winged helix-turn-helix transcriptional regulator [Nocardioidaceae bacterium]
MTTRWLDSDQQRAWRAYLLGTTLLMERLDRDLRDKHGLSLPEYEILVRLSEAPHRALRMAELADSVRYSRSRITHTIARMEREGMVERSSCASDGRGVFAIMTAAGYDVLVTAAPDHVESVRRGLVDTISPNDMVAVGRAFSQVIASLETGAPDPLLSPRSTAPV